MSDTEWEYGFYDSEDVTRTCYWYVFGILKHDTPESAEHTGWKSTSGQPVIVVRPKGTTDPDTWAHYTPASKEASDGSN
jgi:hypothetical protein